MAVKKILRLAGLLALLGLLFVYTRCREESPYFLERTHRSKVYKLLGQPANRDSEVVAVWVYSKKGITRSSSWRELMREHRVKYVVVFDENDKSIMPLVSPAQTSIESDMSDGDARESARRFTRIR